MSRTSLLMPLDGNTYRLCNTKLLLHSHSGSSQGKTFSRISPKNTEISSVVPSLLHEYVNNSRTPNYLAILIPNCKHVANIRNYVYFFNCRTSSLDNYFTLVLSPIGKFQTIIFTSKLLLLSVRQHDQFFKVLDPKG